MRCCINTQNITESREPALPRLINICLVVVFLFIFEYVWQRKSGEVLIKGENRLVCPSGILLSALLRKPFGFTGSVCHQIIKLGFEGAFVFKDRKMSTEAWSLLSSLPSLTT